MLLKDCYQKPNKKMQVAKIVKQKDQVCETREEGMYSMRAREVENLGLLIQSGIISRRHI